MVRRSMSSPRALLEKLTLEIEDQNDEAGVEVSVDTDPELTPTISRCKTPSLDSPSIASASMDLSPVSQFRLDSKYDTEEDERTTDVVDSLLVPHSRSSDEGPVRLNSQADETAKEHKSDYSDEIVARPEDDAASLGKEQRQPIRRFQQLHFDRQETHSTEVRQGPLHALELPSLVDTPTASKSDKFSGRSSTNMRDSPDLDDRNPKATQSGLHERLAAADDAKHARFAGENDDEGLRMVRSLSMTESDVGSLDGLPSNVQSQWKTDKLPRENMQIGRAHV